MTTVGVGAATYTKCGVSIVCRVVTSRTMGSKTWTYHRVESETVGMTGREREGGWEDGMSGADKARRSNRTELGAHYPDQGLGRIKAAECCV